MHTHMPRFILSSLISSSTTRPGHDVTVIPTSRVCASLFVCAVSSRGNVSVGRESAREGQPLVWTTSKASALYASPMSECVSTSLHFTGDRDVTPPPHHNLLPSACVARQSHPDSDSPVHASDRQSTCPASPPSGPPSALWEWMLLIRRTAAPH